MIGEALLDQVQQGLLLSKPVVKHKFSVQYALQFDRVVHDSVIRDAGSLYMKILTSWMSTPFWLSCLLLCLKQAGGSRLECLRRCDSASLCTSSHSARSSCVDSDACRLPDFQFTPHRSCDHHNNILHRVVPSSSMQYTRISVRQPAPTVSRQCLANLESEPRLVVCLCRLRRWKRRLWPW